jgi:hypothetical protein
MGKPIFFKENVKDITDQWLKKEITYGRMIELLNETIEPHIVKAFDNGKLSVAQKGQQYYDVNYKIWKNQK